MGGGADDPEPLKLLSETQKRVMAEIARSANQSFRLNLPKVNVPEIANAVRSAHVAAAGAIERLWIASTPNNWRGVKAADVDVCYACADGINLVWVPRAELVEELVAADQATRPRILENNAESILDDLTAILAESRSEELRGHADASAFAAESISAGRRGDWTGAQALAACGLGPIIHQTFNSPQIAQLRKRFEAYEVDEATIEVLKWTLLAVCLVPAINRTDRVPPTLFNRNGTVHGIRVYFSKPNAIGGMLLLVGWLRELSWLEEHRPGAFTDVQR